MIDNPTARCSKTMQDAERAYSMPCEGRLPSMVSYAQNFEDVLLRRVFFGQESGFYIDIGAADPIYDSVTMWAHERGWSGINIEPTAAFHERLKSLRTRDVNLDVAVGRTVERRPFFEVSNSALSTLDAAVAESARALGYVVTRRDVAVTTLKKICEEFKVSQIDFLKIDAEGWEAEILAGADWQVNRPRVVLVEATAPNTTRSTHSEWEPTLLSAGYVFACFDGLNRYYVRTEDAILADRLRLPPNYFDNFHPLRQIEMENRLAVAEQQRDALNASIDAAHARLRELQLERDALSRAVDEARSELGRVVGGLETKPRSLIGALKRSFLPAVTRRSSR
jgi:FkbM family methyltransferase